MENQRQLVLQKYMEGIYDWKFKEQTEGGGEGSGWEGSGGGWQMSSGCENYSGKFQTFPEVWNESDIVTGFTGILP